MSARTAAAGPELEGPMGASLPAELRDLAGELFGPQLPLAERFADLLASQGVTRGLIGPREGERLWERHLLNCALLVRALPADAQTVADVGSGAGLPGIVLAIARPGLQLTLIETMQRRCVWLQEVVDQLGLEHVRVLRARAEEVDEQFDVVTARAVAALDKLARWSLPLVREGGVLLAMKGSAAAEEITGAAEVLASLGGRDPQVLCEGEGQIPVPTTVVSVRVQDRPETDGATGRRASSSGRGASRRSGPRQSTKGSRHGRSPR